MKRNHALLGSLVVAFLASLARGNVIVLENGNELRGKIKARVGDVIVVELPYGTLQLDRREVVEIRAEEEAEYLERTGESLLGHRDTQRGVEYLRRAYRTSPSDRTRDSLVRALVAWAESALEERRFRRLDLILDEIRGLEPESEDLTVLERTRRTLIERREKLDGETRLALEERRLDAAVDGFRTLMAEFPESRSRWRQPFAISCVLRGHERLRAKRYPDAADDYREALVQDPDLVSVLDEPLAYAEIEAVRPLLESRRFEVARTRLRSARDVLPHHPAILYFSAVAAEASGAFDEAADLYRILAGPDGKSIDAGAHLGALRRAAESALQIGSTREVRPTRSRWDDAEVSEGTLESRHFVVHYRVRARAEQVTRELEAQLLRLKRKWFRGGAFLTQKVPIHLHGSSSDYCSATGAPTWTSGVTRSERRFGQLLGQEIHFDASAPQFESAVIPHELTHLVVPHLLGLGSRLPLWVDEGLATLEEPEFKQRYFTRLVAEAHRDRLLFPIEDILTRSSYPEEARIQLFYSQANSLTRFLVEKLGRGDALALFAQLTTTPPETAIPGLQGFESLDHLDRAWKRWFSGTR